MARGTGTLPSSRKGSPPALFVVLVLLLFVSTGNGQSGPEEACKNAYSVGEPNCRNGGTLYFENVDQSHPTSCAHCNCPKGWRGADCSRKSNRIVHVCVSMRDEPRSSESKQRTQKSNDGAFLVCESMESCPPIKVNNQTLEALDCTNTTLIPNEEETIVGKRLSCVCGGDPFSDFACLNQPDMNMAVELTGDLSKEEALMKVKLFSGMPSQTAPCTKEACYPKKRYLYAYPQAWEADFLHCKSTTEDCELPMDRKKKCTVIHCSDSDVSCPPKNVPKCPEWSSTSPYCAGFKCENATQCPPNGDSDFWQHHCYKTATPPQNSPITFRCTEEPTEKGNKFHCAFAYQGMNFPSFIGLECSVGNCIYQKSGPPPPPPPYVPPAHTPTHIPHLILMLCCSLVAFALVGIIIYNNNQKDTLPTSILPHMLPTSQKNDVALEESLLQHEKTRNYISWKNLSCTSTAILKRFGQPLLSNVHGWAGHLMDDNGLTAIMGPSGAGKTTLLDAIAGRSKSVQVRGEVRLNGWKASPKQLRAISGFVTQDDILPGTSTVWEYFIFNAMLRMPQQLQKEYKRQRVFEIIQQLGLSKVAMSLIGDEFVRGLSGGEKRRLSIGIEILICPPVLFLDEPLSGLDSSNASKVMSILGDIATSGVAVVLTLHQPRPDMLLSIDRLMILSAGGCTVYSGPTSQLDTYLGELGHSVPESMTAVDFLLELLVDSADNVVAKITEAYSKSELMGDEMKQLEQLILNTKQNSSSIPVISSSCSAAYEFTLLLKRSVIANVRSPLLITLNLFSSLLVAFSVGFIFKNAGTDTSGIQKRMGSLFFILLYLAMISLGSVPVWHQNYKVFLKEHSSGMYRIWTYFLAVVMNEFVLLRSLPPTAFCLSYYLINLRGGVQSSHIVTFLTALILANCTLTGIVFVIGASTRKTSLANVIGSVVMLLSALFAGYLLNKSDMSKLISLLSHVSPLEYAFQILLVNEFHGLPKGYFHFTDPSNKGAAGIPVSGDTILVTFGFYPGGNFNNYITLGGILLASLVISFMLLKSGTFRH